MNSMTGYGFKEAVVENTHISVEIRSVNSRFLDLGISLPPFLNSLEGKLRKIVSGKIARGKVDLTIRVKDMSSTAVVSPDTNAALMYRGAIEKIANALGYDSSSIPLSLVIAQDGVLNVTHEYDADKYWEKIRPVFEEVFDQFVSDRAREGENLKADLLRKLDALDSCASFFKKWQPKMEQKFKEQITARFNELLGDNADQNRIMSEVAAMMVKYTINEEIVRLESHLKALRNEFNTNPVPGKRIDFICQEANREINTIGSKNQFTEVGEMVINAKDALENIREQSKNVE